MPVWLCLCVGLTLLIAKTALGGVVAPSTAGDVLRDSQQHHAPAIRATDTAQPRTAVDEVAELIESTESNEKGSGHVSVITLSASNTTALSARHYHQQVARLSSLDKIVLFHHLTI